MNLSKDTRDEEKTWWTTVKDTLTLPGRVSEAITSAAPALIFVIASATSSMRLATIAAGTAAVGAVAWQRFRGKPLRHAVIGLAVVAACAVVASLTGEARGFFLLPALLPFAVIIGCLASVLVRRPLTGLLLNRISGGPANWFKDHRLRSVYNATTLVCAGVNVVNGTLQAILYFRSNTLVLVAAHIATGPIFAVIVAVTVVFARRAMPARHLPSQPEH